MNYSNHFCAISESDELEKQRRRPQSSSTNNRICTYKALEDVNVNSLPIRKSAKKNTTTLQDWINEKYDTHGKTTYLSYEEERQIVEWITSISAAGFRVSKLVLTECIKLYVKTSDREYKFKDFGLGQDWFDRFVERYDAISFRESESINKYRVAGTKENVREWFGSVSFAWRVI